MLAGRPLSHGATTPGPSDLPTSSALLGRGASSGFFIIFCFRLSLLAGRVAAFWSSTSLEVDRFAVGVPPRTVRALGAMVTGCCELEGWWAWAVEDDEFLGRAVAGGVVRLRLSMAATLQLMEEKSAVRPYMSGALEESAARWPGSRCM